MIYKKNNNFDKFTNSNYKHDYAPPPPDPLKSAWDSIKDTSLMQWVPVSAAYYKVKFLTGDTSVPL